MSNDNVALFDMDGSLFDYEAALVRDLKSMRSPDEPEITDLWTMEKQPYFKARMDFIKSCPGWWRDLAPIKNGFRIFKLAQEIGFDCHILTKGPKTKTRAWGEKLDCCQVHFGPDVDVHVTSNKKLTYGKFLYDDFPDYMNLWLSHRPRGLGIMPATNGNKNYSHPQVIKWDGTNFAEVKEALVYCFNRLPGNRLQLNESTWVG